MNDFVDKDAINAVLEKAAEALGPVGLTFDPDAVQITMQQGNLFAIIPALVQPGAKQKLDEDRDARDDFLKTMKEQAEAKVNKQKEEFAKMLEHDFDEDAIHDDCPHEKRHPSTGHCLMCGDGLED